MQGAVNSFDNSRSRWIGAKVIERVISPVGFFAALRQSNSCQEDAGHPALWPDAHPRFHWRLTRAIRQPAECLSETAISFPQIQGDHIWI